MSKTIGGHTEKHLLNVAKDVVLSKTKDSKILDEDAEARIPKYDSKGTTMHHVYSVFPLQPTHMQF